MSEGYLSPMINEKYLQHSTMARVASRRSFAKSMKKGRPIAGGFRCIAQFSVHNLRCASRLEETFVEKRQFYYSPYKPIVLS